MKNLLFLLVVVLFISCAPTGDNKPSSQGAPYEIIVVADHTVWDGAAGEAIRAMLQQRVPMVNREEPQFDVLRVLPAGFKNLVTRHPNILIVRIDPTVAEPLLGMNENVYAAPQAVLTLSAPDEESLVQLINDQRENIMLVLEAAHRMRDVSTAQTHTPKEIATVIEQKFGITLATYPGYVVAGEKEDFLWLRYEMPTASQGIVVYTYPFESSMDLTEQNILKRRDEFVANIPGEVAGSHMATNTEMHEMTYKTIHGRPWVEVRGFWRVQGDYMGGPFVSYSTLDMERSRIVVIDFYVYSPQLKQRNFIRQLEHLIYTAKI